MRKYLAETFEAQDPAAAVDHALQLIDAGQLPTFFLEIDGGAIAPEIKELVLSVRGLHGNIGSSAMSNGHTLWEMIEVTPRRKIDGMEQNPRGQQVIVENREKLEKAFEKVLQAGGEIVVEKTTEQHQVWLDNVIEPYEESKAA